MNLRAIAAVLSTSFFAVTICLAQDAVKADSTHYSIVLENEHVRVLHIHYGAHEKGNMHSHPCSVTVFLTDGNLRMTMPDGKTMIGTVKAGQTVWEDAGSHQPENIGDQAFDAIRTELKNPQDCIK